MKYIFKYLLIFTLLCSLESFANIGGTLLIVHPSRTFDPNQVAKKGIEEIISYYDNLSLPVLHINHDDDSIFSSYPKDLDSYYIHPKPHHILFFDYSGSVEHTYKYTNEVTIVGGYYYFCLAKATGYVIANWEKQRNPGEILTINLYMPGIFTVSKGNYLGPKSKEPWPYPLPEYTDLPSEVTTLNTCDTEREFDNYFYGVSHINLDSIGSANVENEESLIYKNYHYLKLMCGNKLIATYGNIKNPEIIIRFIDKI